MNTCQNGKSSAAVTLIDNYIGNCNGCWKTQFAKGIGVYFKRQRWYTLPLVLHTEMVCTSNARDGMPSHWYYTLKWCVLQTPEMVCPQTGITH